MLARLVFVLTFLVGMIAAAAETDRTRHFEHWRQRRDEIARADLEQRWGAAIREGTDEITYLIGSAVEEQLRRVRAMEASHLEDLYELYSAGSLDVDGAFERLTPVLTELMNELKRAEDRDAYAIRLRRFVLHVDAALLFSAGPISGWLTAPSSAFSEKLSHYRLRRNTLTALLLNGYFFGVAGLGVPAAYLLPEEYLAPAVVALMGTSIGGMVVIADQARITRWLDVMSYLSWRNPRLKRLINAVAEGTPDAPKSASARARWFFEIYSGEDAHARRVHARACARRLLTST